MPSVSEQVRRKEQVADDTRQYQAAELDARLKAAREGRPYIGEGDKPATQVFQHPVQGFISALRQGLGIDKPATMRFDSAGQTKPLTEKPPPFAHTRALLNTALDIAGGRGGVSKPVPIQGRKVLQEAKRIFGSPQLTGEKAQDPYLKRVLDKATSWWHGSGADPAEVSQGLKGSTTPYGAIPGEPAGVSITPLTGTASGFGEHLYRLHPGLSEGEILRLYTRQGAKDYQDIVRKSLDPAERFLALEDRRLLDRLTKMPGTPVADALRAGLPHEERLALAQKIQERMQREGLGGLLYPPQRYGEHELRHVTPEKIKLIERRGEVPLMEPDIYGDYSTPPFPRGFAERQELSWAQAHPLFNPQAQVKSILENAVRERYGFAPREPMGGKNLQVAVPSALAGDQRAEKFVLDHLNTAKAQGLQGVEFTEKNWDRLPKITQYRVYKEHPWVKIPEYGMKEFANEANRRYLDNILALQQDLAASQAAKGGKGQIPFIDALNVPQPVPKSPNLIGGWFDPQNPPPPQTPQAVTDWIYDPKNAPKILKSLTDTD